jgi:predicted N-formylglutamate amidohydrolase
MGVAATVRSKLLDPDVQAADGGLGPFVITCDHASNAMPAEFARLGLSGADLLRHIAWDPGALGVSRAMSQRLSAPVIAGRVSRLLVDCNRPLDAPDLIAEVSERTIVQGNANLTPKQRLERIERFYDPFHEALDRAVTGKIKQGVRPGLIAVHSFNPVYKGVSRPWEIGIIHDDEDEWALAIVDRLKAKGSLSVGVNEPYSPKDRVYYTLERHARSRGLPAVMIEIRNDEIAGARDQQRWGDLLAEIVEDTYKNLKGGNLIIGVAGARAAGS